MPAAACIRCTEPVLVIRCIGGISMTQTLKQGDRGALVSLLQLGLERAGQTPGALDGIFGAQTAAAMRARPRNTFPGLIMMHRNTVPPSKRPR